MNVALPIVNIWCSLWKRAVFYLLPCVRLSRLSKTNILFIEKKYLFINSLLSSTTNFPEMRIPQKTAVCSTSLQKPSNHWRINPPSRNSTNLNLNAKPPFPHRRRRCRRSSSPAEKELSVSLNLIRHRRVSLVAFRSKPNAFEAAAQLRLRLLL